MGDTQNNKKGRFLLMEEDTQNNSLSLDVDLVINILLRLPEKSLVRFRCVSKSWISLITGQSFIRLYLETNKPSQSQNSNSLILVGTNTILTYDFSGAQIVSKLPNPPTLLTRDSLIGSSNGLICFLHQVHTLSVTISLYNPTTQAYRVLPTLEIWEDLLFWGYSLISSFFGLGYDYKSNDFKIVSLLAHPHIYRLRTNSWELIRPSPDFKFTIQELGRGNGKISVVSNNALHQIVSSGILGFNLATEEFYRVPLPGMSSWPDDSYLDLTDLRGCLHLLVAKNFYKPSPFSIKIWVMKKYGVKESWTKLLRYKSKEVDDLVSSSGLCFVPRLYVYSKDDQEILVSVESFQKYFFSCHLQTREVKKVEDLSNFLKKNEEGFFGMPWTCTFADVI